MTVCSMTIKIGYMDVTDEDVLRWIGDHLCMLVDNAMSLTGNEVRGNSAARYEIVELGEAEE